MVVAPMETTLNPLELIPGHIVQTEAIWSVTSYIGRTPVVALRSDLHMCRLVKDHPPTNMRSQFWSRSAYSYSCF